MVDTGASARLWMLGSVVLSLGMLMPVSPAHADTSDTISMETVEVTTCRLIEAAALGTGLPASLLTRLIWIESRFQAGVTSPAGAQGIGQFMPQTAAERGLADPYDPEQAIPKAAELLVDLERQFGNIGLAAAAYNAGSARVRGWLTGSGPLPTQTQVYVFQLTGRIADDWAVLAREGVGGAGGAVSSQSCIEIAAALRQEEGTEQPPLAPWGVQLAGNFSKAIALASFERARERYPMILAGVQPMIIGSRLRSRGTRRFYRVLIPAASRAEGDQICHAIMAAGGACASLRS
jgi:hypothetical protein